jgi:hypothetical protein
MAKVQEATFTATKDGGEMRATIVVGDQELTSKWPVTSWEGELNSLLNDLMVRVQQVSFVSTDTGGEIRANMEVGGQVFISRWLADDSNPELRDRFDRLLDEVCKKSVTNLQAALEHEKEPA